MFKAYDCAMFVHDEEMILKDIDLVNRYGMNECAMESRHVGLARELTENWKCGVGGEMKRERFYLDIHAPWYVYFRR